jgi:hypothetical protein
VITIPERQDIKDEGIKKAFDNFDWSLRCASPGIIRAFDKEAQTVEVEVAITERIKVNGEERIEKIPILLDVPICIPSAGGYSLSLPIVAGDECLIIFSDTCFDAWWQNGDVQNQMELRRHDLSDAFAIVGIKSKPNVIANYSADSAQLRNAEGTNYVELSDSEASLVFGGSSISVKNGEISLDATSVKIQGVEFLTHIHGGVTSGDEMTTGVILPG